MSPFAQGVLIVGELNLLAVGAALAVCIRLRPSGRAELGVAVGMLWNFLVMCPVYALGLTNHLYPRTLAWAATSFFSVVYLVARGLRTPAAFEREVAARAWSLVRLPWDAVVAAVRARSLVTLGIVTSLTVFWWTLICAYYSPSWRQWDALWYHEPIVGFTLQNHGFRMVDLPGGGPQKINGYPRLCEMTQLWFVIFTDRRVLDMVSHVSVPPLALATYLLARRHVSQVMSMGFASALVLMPATAMLLGSCYVDVHNAAFVLAGAYFATRTHLRMRDAIMAAVCLSLAVGSKHMAIVPVLVLSSLTAARILGEPNGRKLAAVGTVLFGASLIIGTGATTYVRNWLYFKNPFWPEFKFDNETLGIHWPGSFEWGSGEYEKGVSRLDMNLQPSDLIEEIYQIPYTVGHSFYTQMYEYGVGVTWVVAPVAFLAVIALLCTPALDLLGIAFRLPALRSSVGTRSALLVALTVTPMIYFTPALWGARYQIAATGLGLSLVAWVAGRRGFERLGENFVGALTVMSLMSVAWTTPRFWLWWSEAKALAQIPYPEREFTPATTIGPTLDQRMGSAITTKVGLAREKQQAPGAIFAFSDNYSTYMALFWNNDYSNRVVWIPDGPNFMERLNASQALWVYSALADPSGMTLRKPESGWEEVGILQTERWGTVYKRVAW